MINKNFNALTVKHQNCASKALKLFQNCSLFKKLIKRFKAEIDRIN